jgi:NAD(P)-dependent dehydrogenase (short-subunit alcohol dehydrogenase family)
LNKSDDIWQMFNFDNIPSQKGRIAVVTGANAGIGYETALAFARKDLKVVMACRSPEKAEKARLQILREVPGAELEIMELDLSRMRSVRSFSEEYQHRYDRLDLLINNAGVMVAPKTTTEDGFELHIATNYLGHFLLTGLLLGPILQTPGSRVVSLSSTAHKTGRINLDDFHGSRRYYSFFAYSQSKLACLMFAYELQRRLERQGASTISTAAHPGTSYTDIVRNFPYWIRYLAPPFAPLITHPPKQAAEPTLLAALGEGLRGGEYFGPDGWLEFKGRPRQVDSTRASKDPEMAKRLWALSEELTCLEYL